MSGSVFSHLGLNALLLVLVTDEPPPGLLNGHSCSGPLQLAVNVHQKALVIALKDAKKLSLSLFDWKHNGMMIMIVDHPEKLAHNQGVMTLEVTQTLFVLIFCKFLESSERFITVHALCPTDYFVPVFDVGELLNTHKGIFE